MLWLIAITQDTRKSVLASVGFDTWGRLESREEWDNGSAAAGKPSVRAAGSSANADDPLSPSHNRLSQSQRLVLS